MKDMIITQEELIEKMDIEKVFQLIKAGFVAHSLDLHLLSKNQKYVIVDLSGLPVQDIQIARSFLC